MQIAVHECSWVVLVIVSHGKHCLAGVSSVGGMKTSKCTHSIEQLDRQLDLDIGFVDSVWSSACQRDEAISYEDVPKQADALISLSSGDVCPGRLLV